MIFLLSLPTLNNMQLSCFGQSINVRTVLCLLKAFFGLELHFIRLLLQLLLAYFFLVHFSILLFFPVVFNLIDNKLLGFGTDGSRTKIIMVVYLRK